MVFHQDKSTPGLRLPDPWFSQIGWTGELIAENSSALVVAAFENESTPSYDELWYFPKVKKPKGVQIRLFCQHGIIDPKMRYQLCLRSPADTSRSINIEARSLKDLKLKSLGSNSKIGVLRDYTSNLYGIEEHVSISPDWEKFAIWYGPLIWVVKMNGGTRAEVSKAFEMSDGGEPSDIVGATITRTDSLIIAGQHGRVIAVKTNRLF